MPESESYKIKGSIDFDHFNEKIRSLKKYGDLETVFRFPDIQQFVNYKKSRGKKDGEYLYLSYEQDDRTLMVEFYIPEDVEEILSYIDPNIHSKVKIREVDYTELTEYTRLDMKLFNNEIESIETLILGSEEFEDFDVKFIDQFNIRSLRCVVEPMSSLKILDRLKTPVSLELLGDFELYKPICKNTVSLEFTCVDDAVVQDLSYLHNLKELKINVVHDKVTDFDIKYPENLQELRIKCKNEYVYKRSHNKPSIGFPKSLKLLVLQNMHIPVDTDLGESLEELGLINSNDSLKIPSGLKKANICCYKPSNPEIPRSLEELSLLLINTTVPDLKSCSNLKKLLIEAQGTEATVELPENLEVLVLRDTKNKYVLNDKLIDIAMDAPTDSITLQTNSFPSSLKFAQLTQCDLKWVNYLPSSLKFLEIEVETSSPCTLPSGLKALKLRDKSLTEAITLPENLQLFLGTAFEVSQGFIDKLPKSLKTLSITTGPWDEGKFDFDFSEYQITDLELGFPTENIEKLILPATLNTLLLPNCNPDDLQFLDTSDIEKVYASLEMGELKVLTRDQVYPKTYIK